MTFYFSSYYSRFSPFSKGFSMASTSYVFKIGFHSIYCWCCSSLRRYCSGNRVVSCLRETEETSRSTDSLGVEHTFPALFHIFSPSHMYATSIFTLTDLVIGNIISRNSSYSPVGHFGMLFQMFISEHWSSGSYQYLVMSVTSIGIIIRFRHMFLKACLPNIPWWLEDWSSKMGAFWPLIHQNA